MAFTLRTSASASSDNAGTTLNLPAITVVAGDLVVMWCKHEGAADTTTTASDATSGGNVGTNGTYQSHSNNDLHGRWVYWTASAGGSLTHQMRTAAREFRRAHIWVFNPAGASVTLDAQSVGQGASTAIASGNLTTTGTDEVVLGGYGEYDAVVATAPLVNGVAADGSIINSPANSYAASWYRILTATITGGASLTKTGTTAWLCHAIAFKAVAGGGITGTANATVRRPTCAATGTVVVSAAAAPSIQRATASSSGTVRVTGALDASVRRAACAATGTVRVAGTAAATVSRALGSAAGTIRVAGTAAGSVQRPTCVATGTVSTAGGITGTLVASVTRPTCVATGTVRIAALAAAVATRPTASASGTVRISASAAAIAPRATSSSSGTVRVSGTGAASAQRAVSIAAGAVRVSGALAALLRRPTCSAAGLVGGELAPRITYRATCRAAPPFSAATSSAASRSASTRSGPPYTITVP